MVIEFGHKFGDPYDALLRLPPGLLMDVGAAIGHTASKMRRRSAQSEIIAFEPNPANWPFFEEHNRKHSMITLIKAAVADKAGTVRFSAPVKINAAEGAWAQYSGASSVGKVTDDGEFEIPAVTLDETIGDREVLFCKIDVQGFEAKVLQGAQKAIRERRIKMLQIEFMIYPEIFPLLQGYRCFSQEWAIIPRTHNRLGPPDMGMWELGPARQMSTGRTAYRGWPKTHPHTPEEFVAFQVAENAKIGRCWTDLLFVAPDFAETFMAAAAGGPKAKH